MRKLEEGGGRCTVRSERAHGKGKQSFDDVLEFQAKRARRMREKACRWWKWIHKKEERSERRCRAFVLVLVHAHRLLTLHR